jgi:transcriptional regulator
MYVPAHFEETRLEVLHGLIRARPLATLVTLSSGGIDANHIPLHLEPQAGPFGALRGHVARANPMWSDRVAGAEALAIFHGADGYISPSWYPTKREHGKVVPTWNYVVVHAYGALRVIDDPVWLRALLEALVDRHEASSAAPWSVADAPAEFIERMIGSIVGFEIAVSKLVGKWKLSQNQPAQNRAGVIGALRGSADVDSLEMADLVEKAARDDR